MEAIANLSPSGALSRRKFLAALGAVRIAPQVVLSAIGKPSTMVEVVLPEITADASLKALHEALD